MPHTRFTRTRSGRVKLTLVVTVCILLAGAAFAAKFHLTAAHAVSAAAPSPPTIAAPPADPARLESEHITIRPSGFEPAEITRPAGRILLSVNDRSGLDSLDLRLNVENVRRLFEARVPRDTKGRHEWRQVVTLPPGRYVLTEAGHPDWVCRITITDN